MLFAPAMANMGMLQQDAHLAKIKGKREKPNTERGDEVGSERTVDGQSSLRGELIWTIDDGEIEKK